MFKRKTDYYMALDVEVNRALVEQLKKAPEAAGVPSSAVEDMALFRLITSIETAARQSVQINGQEWQTIKLNTEGALGPRVEVWFKGDLQGAKATADQWTEDVRSLNVTGRILWASFRGEIEQNADGAEGGTREGLTSVRF
jgi:hypothetical protein